MQTIKERFEKEYKECLKKIGYEGDACVEEDMIAEAMFKRGILAALEGDLKDLKGFLELTF